MWTHVHLYQEALLQADTLCSAYPHIQGKFHRTSNNWRRKVPTQWHFQASTTMLRQHTHVETSRNVHSNGTLSTSLKMDTNMNANMDTNHTAHRYRHTRKEVHLLSEPPELRPLKAMAHRHTRKEDHLLSGPSELQPTEDSETQKFDSAHVLVAATDSRQEYSRSTETNKAKFQNPFIYNDDRNFVWHNSVSKISPDLVFMTTQNTASVSNSVFCRKKGRKRGRCRDSRNCRRYSRRTCTCTYSRRTCTCTCTYSHTGDSP